MKKITLLFLLINAIGFAQTCSQTFTATGNDDDPTVLTINASDITCQGSEFPDSMTLTNTSGDLNNLNCTSSSPFYKFAIAIDNVELFSGCGSDFEGIDITGFNTLTITSDDVDAFSDNVTITIDVEVAFTATMTPDCSSLLLTSPVNNSTDAALDGNLVWDEASGATGYTLTIGTTSGGDEFLSTTDIGDVSEYAVGLLEGNTTYYVSIESYNTIGISTNCIEQSFTTFTPLAYNVCDTAQALSVGTSINDSSFIATLVDSSNSGEGQPNCSEVNFIPNEDVWFSAVVPASGYLTVETTEVPGSILLDTILVAYTGSCDNLTEIACNDDSVGGFSLLDLPNLTPGETLYIRAIENNYNIFDRFNIHVYDTTVLSIEDNIIDGFSMYPNPVQDNLNLRADAEINEISVFNLRGQEVIRKSPNTNQVALNMTTLNTGMYVVKVHAGDKVSTYQVMKK